MFFNLTEFLPQYKAKNMINSISFGLSNYTKLSFKGSQKGDVVEIEGTQTKAKVYTKNIDAPTTEQIQRLCSHPVFKDMPVRIMPDTHLGKVAVVGFTAPINPKGEIIPAIIGNDIGCGMLCCEIDTGNKEIDFDKLDKVIRNFINSSEFPKDLSLNPDFQKTIQNLCPKLNTSAQQQIGKLATLGSGNHFIEIDKNENGKTYMVIHTGSRNLGGQVASKYCEIASKQNPYPNGMSYLSGDEGKEYLEAVKIASQYAQLNRRLIADKIIKDMGWTEKSSFESVHNYIGEDGIIRKGAISAKKGERVIIPLNMHDGSLIAEGKGNPDWNDSAPHGAGRILSRSEAHKKVSLEDYKKVMQGIYTTCVSSKTLDESPQAYKDAKEIERNIGATVSVQERIKPLYNFKN